MNEEFLKSPSDETLKLAKLKYSLEKKSPIVLTVCIIRPNKGLEHLIKAASMLKDVSFIVVGDIGDQKYFKRLLRLKSTLRADNLKFLGWVPDEDVQSLLFISDLFVLPSISETLPLVILQAMAAGKPIIVTSVGGIPYLIRNQINGLIVPPRDYVAIS